MRKELEGKEYMQTIQDTTKVHEYLIKRFKFRGDEENKSR